MQVLDLQLLTVGHLLLSRDVESREVLFLIYKYIVKRNNGSPGSGCNIKLKAQSNKIHGVVKYIQKCIIKRDKTRDK